jgi:Flp pilus assembly pilin Flp
MHAQTNLIDVGRLSPRHRIRLRHVVCRLVESLRQEDGAATAEYAVATMAAVGFAGLLVAILRGDEVRGILTDLVRRALTTAG